MTEIAKVLKRKTNQDFLYQGNMNPDHISQLSRRTKLRIYWEKTSKGFY
jgi:hypothetical protein